MDLNLKWGHAIRLVSIDGLYEIPERDRIPKRPGIYIFFRVFGNAVEALYVGKAENLNARIKQQLNAHRLMTGIEMSALGQRYVVAGELKRRPGQQVASCLQLSERALIRYYLAEGHKLLNILGKRVRRHSLTSKRVSTVTGRLVPRIIDFE